jgi:hypothetical protein
MEVARILLGVYVADLIITGTSTTAIGEFKSEMMSDLGLLSYYLGIKVNQKPSLIRLGQAAYADKLLEKMGMSSCNSVSVPMESRLKLSKEGSSGRSIALLQRWRRPSLPHPHPARTSSSWWAS